MFCGRCGKENPDDAQFCNSCGSDLNMYRYSSQDKYDTQYGKRPTYVVSGKSAGLGIVLSFLFAGLGHLYAGKIERGLGILIVYVLLLATSFLIFTTIIAIVLWIWAMVDVYGTIDEYNEYLARTGNPPW